MQSPATYEENNDFDEEEPCEARDNDPLNVEQTCCCGGKVLHLGAGEQRPADVEPERQADERSELRGGAEHRRIALKTDQKLHPE